MSAKELKIREELEKDIESGLEEEIKDGMYHLALRLHRLYQHRGQKIVAAAANTIQSQGTKNATLSEVNINIKMEGGSKIEIKETTKEAACTNGARPRTSQNHAPRTLKTTHDKRIDWIKTLRSGPNFMSTNKTQNNTHQPKATIYGSSSSNKCTFNQNLKHDYARRNCVSAPRQRKASVEVNKELLEMGWKN